MQFGRGGGEGLLDIVCFFLPRLVHEGKDNTIVSEHHCTVAVQDKYLQKQHFQKAQVPLGDFCEVSDAEQAQQAGKRFEYPLMLKSRRLAYDGRGNAVVAAAGDLEGAVQQLGGYKHGLYAERWTPFVKVLLLLPSLLRMPCSRRGDSSLASVPGSAPAYKDTTVGVA